MKTTNRIYYEAPATAVVELKTQGIICVSVSGNVNATMSGVFTEETILP